MSHPPAGIGAGVHLWDVVAKNPNQDWRFISASIQNRSQDSQTFEIVHTPGAPCGPHLGSNFGPWVSLEDAVAKAQAAGYVPGVTCAKIQHAGGVCYLYGLGDSSGCGGAETYTLVSRDAPASAAAGAAAEPQTAERGPSPGEGQGETPPSVEALSADGAERVPSMPRQSAE